MFEDWQPVIGLEIHAQLLTESKCFSPDPAAFSDKENTNIHPVSLGLPGTLPVPNLKVFEYAARAGLAMKCEIQKTSLFARKNYFYPDLPKGYQISQYEKPLCEKGYVEFDWEGLRHKVRIQRIHIEEDAGRFHHRGSFSLVNFNRAGVPLVEIVTEPDISSPPVAAQMVRTLRKILRYLNICDGNLEEGSLRCDCNVSVKKKGDTALGKRVELKNINSFKFIEKSLEYEIKRQIQILNQGGEVYQETRLYDSAKNKTFPLRSKEEASDYRYFPDPDLMPVSLSEEWILKQKKQLPELPLEKSDRFEKQYGLPHSEASVLTEDQALATYFEQVAGPASSGKQDSPKDPKSFAGQAAKWILNELLAKLKDSSVFVTDCPVSPPSLRDLLVRMEQGEISGKMAKQVFEQMWQTGQEARVILKKLNLKQITDPKVLSEMVEQVMARCPGQVKDYQKGKEKLFGFFVGQVMKQSRGQASPELLNRILKQKLNPPPG